MLTVTIFILIFASHLQAEVYNSNSITPKIINGTDAKNKEFPYLVSLQSLAFSVHFCGGSIISSKYVVTAAHCVILESSRTMKVVAGTLKLNQPKSTHYVSSIILHKKVGYKKTWENDIALIRVIETFKISQTIKLIPLPKANHKIKTNQKAVISGWGPLKVGEKPSNHLQKANVFIADQNLCTQIYKKENITIFDSQVCAYDPKVIRGPCLYDSGGPLTVNGVLIGIASYGHNCAQTDYPSVYTRVPKYISWIKLKTR